MDTKRAYEETDFWSTREGWTVMGDWLGRIPAIMALHPTKGEYIIDAGCGEGLLTRLIAHAGANVIACDRSQTMLDRAKLREAEDFLGIDYHLADITEQLPVRNGIADAVNCVAVLMHSSPDECASFFREAFRALKPNGRILVSITHPYQYLPGSPTRDGRSKWTQYEPLDGGLPMDVSRRFVEHYVNIHGQVFHAKVWYHPEHLLPGLMQEAGLEVTLSQTTYVLPHHIAKSPLWAGSPWGHPAYYQIMAHKP